MGTHRLAPGTVLGRYELLLPIAQGGMATVWAARQKGSRGFSKTVAVKTMLPNLSEDPTFEQMFLDEAAIASRIHHPNVAEILDLGEQDEVLYLVMEWVDGESLSALSKQTKKTETEVPLRVALKIVAQACSGLHAAHELKNDADESVELVHRDVSPQNILVATTGHVKLVDFGVAKALGRAGATSVGQLKGKVPYMSPEQTRGNDVDRRTDIFAMGSVLYRITTGFHPFIEDNDIKTMRSIASRPPIRPRVKNPNLPVELEQVILKALEKNADKRFQTAAELEAQLDKVLNATGGPVSVDEVGAFVRATLGDRDQKRRAALRDAVFAADEERKGLGRAPPSSRISAPTVSDLMLTQAATPPSFATGAVELVEDGSDHHGPESEPPTTAQAPLDAEDESTRVVEPRSEAPVAAASMPATTDGQAKLASPDPSDAPVGLRGPLGDPRLASSPTLAAVTERTGSRPTRSRKLGPVVAASLLLVAAAIAVPALLRKPAAHAKPSAAPDDTSAAATKNEPDTLVRPVTSPTGDAPAAATTEAVSSPPPAASDDSAAFAINELPDNTPGARRPSARALPSAAASARVPPAASGARVDPAKPGDPPKGGPPATPSSKPWVPAVQDPGF